MKETIKVAAKESDVFVKSCQELDIKNSILTADPMEYAFEVEFKFPMQLFYLGRLFEQKSFGLTINRTL